MSKARACKTGHRNQTPSKDANTKLICSKHVFQQPEVESVQSEILKWYDKEQRILPWREIAKTETDPNIRGYAVWVSEIMLQQTQVATVIPYFNKWLKKWPTVKDLAGAELEEVLQVWAGLGYYSRGRRLHEGAKIVMNELNGNIPHSVPDLVKLIPGIGAYSASAIASVAFQKVAGIVDGNVVRVLSRMRVISGNVAEPRIRDHLWKLANGIVSNDRPGDFNQALMELGATVCTPQSPNCAKCPVSSWCSAYSQSKESKSSKPRMFQSIKNKVSKKKSEKSREISDIENLCCDFCMKPAEWEKNPQVTAYPVKVEKKPPRLERVNVLLVKKDDKYLVVRRPEKGLLAGLWEFPSVLIPDGSTPKMITDALNLMMKDLGLSLQLLPTKQHIGEVVHLFSHIHTTYSVDCIVIDQKVDLEKVGKDAKWILEKELLTEAISTAMKKVHALYKKSFSESKNIISNRKRKLKTDDTSQKSIKTFFHKCQH